jgi:large repetitive protein
LSSVTASISTPITCNGGSNGAVTCTTPTGGTGAYSYSWNTTPVQNTQTATALGFGNYTVTVKDANNCSTTASVNLTQPTALSSVTASVSTAILCNGVTNGAVTCTTPTGGTGAYSFSWNTTPIQNTQTATTLGFGNYTVTVKDANNCSTTASINLTQPTALSSVTASISTPITCNGGSNGAVTCTTPTGGTGAYSYSWNTTPIQNTQTASALSFGNYTVTVKDANNCSTTASVNLTQPTALSSVTASVSTSILCNGGTNGAVTCTTPTGGTGTYTFSWNTTPVQNTQTATALGFGNYTVTVKDANNCSTTASVNLTQPTALSSVTASVSTAISCNGGTNGAVTCTTPTGGTGAYTYSWNTTPIQNTQTATTLGFGNYTVTVKDANNCSTTASVNLTQPTALSSVTASVSTAISCNGGTNGAVTCTTPTGGTGTYSYSWNTTPVQNTQTATGLGFGNYTVTVKDANNCSTTASINLTQPNPMANVGASVVNNVSCFNGSNGRATCSTPTGGTAPYSFRWNTSPIQFTQSIANLPAGTYTVIVKDANNCTPQFSTVTIFQPAAPTPLQATILHNISCFGGSNGSVTVSTPTSGTSPFSYAWNTTPIQNTQTATNLASGTYSVIVTDNFGCPQSTSIIINQPNKLVVTIADSIDAKCNGTTTGSIITNPITGGTPPYQYLWNSFPIQTANNATKLAAGTYKVIVTDSLGCKDSTVASIQEPALLQISNIFTTDITCVKKYEGKAQISGVIGGIPPYTAAWSTTPTQYGLIVDSLSAGYYSVVVTDSNNCKASQNFKINSNAIQAIAYTDTIISSGSSFTLNANQSFGINNTTNYLWTNFSGTSLSNSSTFQVNPTEPTKYILTIYNDSTCKSSDTVLINVSFCGPIIFPNAFTPNADGIDDDFKILNVEDIESLTILQIFNRWGQIVYATNEKTGKWNGTFNGVLQEMDTYVYVCTAVCYGGNVIKTKGDLILVR